MFDSIYLYNKTNSQTWHCFDYDVKSDKTHHLLFCRVDTAQKHSMFIVDNHSKVYNIHLLMCNL